jgi:hypothetical protein
MIEVSPRQSRTEVTERKTKTALHPSFVASIPHANYPPTLGWFGAVSSAFFTAASAASKPIFVALGKARKRGELMMR